MWKPAKRLVNWVVCGVLAIPWFVTYGAWRSGEFASEAIYAVRWRVHRWAYPEKYHTRQVMDYWPEPANEYPDWESV